LAPHVRHRFFLFLPERHWLFWTRGLVFPLQPWALQPNAELRLVPWVQFLYILSRFRFDFPPQPGFPLSNLHIWALLPRCSSLSCSRARRVYVAFSNQRPCVRFTIEGDSSSPPGRLVVERPTQRLIALAASAPWVPRMLPFFASLSEVKSPRAVFRHGHFRSMRHACSSFFLVKCRCVQVPGPPLRFHCCQSWFVGPPRGAAASHSAEVVGGFVFFSSQSQIKLILLFPGRWRTRSSLGKAVEGCPPLSLQGCFDYQCLFCCGTIGLFLLVSGFSFTVFYDADFHSAPCLLGLSIGPDPRFERPASSVPIP